MRNNIRILSFTIFLCLGIQSRTADADTLTVACHSEDDGSINASFQIKPQKLGRLLFDGKIGSLQEGALTLALRLNMARIPSKLTIDTISLTASTGEKLQNFVSLNDFLPVQQTRNYARIPLTIGGGGILDPEGVSCLLEIRRRNAIASQVPN